MQHERVSAAVVTAPQQQPKPPFLRRKQIPNNSGVDEKHEHGSSPSYRYRVVVQEGDHPSNEQIGHQHAAFEIENTPPPAPAATNDSSSLERHLSLTDLIAIGVGGTIGSGLFVLAGLVAHTYAGPATVISWAISGFAACLSGCCYAELSGRIPLPGGAYAYSYVAMGELVAFLVATCLSLEYIAAAGAVARSWGDKVVVWLQEELGDEHWVHDYLGNHGTFSPMALVISLGVILLLLNGVKESKRATNFFTLLKVSLVAFMVIAGTFHVQPSNWNPFVPTALGVSGVFRGATGTFFGYLGYDQVTCLAGEAINPKKNLPAAILATLVLVCILYMLATLVLTGMQPYQDISTVSGFPAAFYAADARMAGQITALGEIVTLPIVVLISSMSQPRLLFALAQDGLLPAYFGQLDANGNLFNGTLCSGALIVIIASLVPFKHLNDMISCAVLTVLGATNTSLILLWHEAPNFLAEQLVLCFHVVAILTGICVARFLNSTLGLVAAVIGGVCLILLMKAIASWCPRAKVFGGSSRCEATQADEGGYFCAPFLPYLPCFGIFVNWLLIAQLEIVGVAGLLGILLLGSLYYFCRTRRTLERVEGPEQVDDGAEQGKPKPGSISLPSLD